MPYYFNVCRRFYPFLILKQGFALCRFCDGQSVKMRTVQAEEHTGQSPAWSPRGDKKAVCHFYDRAHGTVKTDKTPDKAITIRSSNHEENYFQDKAFCNSLHTGRSGEDPVHDHGQDLLLKMVWLPHLL